jgi:flavin reductase (DIM6/NTAB) family NADH-FMN oxidoreductase RutF
MGKGDVMRDASIADDEGGSPGVPGYDRVDATVFRDTLARVPTPVTVVTSHIDRRPHGTTVSAFSSLSLEPPMILVSLDQNSDLLKIIQESGRFGVNVLASGQQSLATTFARKGADKFADVAWYMDHGAPRLAGKGQWLVCRTDQLVTAGDHVIIIGLVVHADTHSFEPLLYRQRAFGTVTHMRG